MIKRVRKRIKKILAGFTLLSLEIIILLIIFSAALVAFLFIAHMIFKDDKTGFDLHAFSFLSPFVSDVNTNVMQFFTFLGTHQFLIPANLVLVAWFLILKKHRWY